MSYPNDPHRQGGQPNWPGPEQDQQPDAQPDAGERTTRVQPGSYQRPPSPHQQPGQYEQPGPYGQPGSYQTPYQQQNAYQPPYQSGGQYQPPGSYQGDTYRQPGPYQQSSPYQGSYPQPGQYQTGPQPTQQFGQPGPYGHPQGPAAGWPTQEQTGQYDYGAPPPGPPGAPYQQLGPEQPKKRTALVIGSIVAVIALVAAGVATYVFAFRGTAAGAATPKEAAVSLVNSLTKNDMVGLFGGLAPAESAVAKDYMTEGVAELKRLEVLKADAKPEQISGVSFKAEDLKFDEANEERVNDHLTITKLVAGKLTISSDWSQLPLTEKFLDKVFRGGPPKSQTQTVDIADQIAKNKGKPIRIATVKVDDQWYPSLYYSIADAALQSANKKWPAQAVAANGADSPEAAVKQLAEAALQADIKRVIELTPPDEMAALHDAGQLVIDSANGEASGGRLTDLQTNVSDVTGGKRVSLVKLAVQAPTGETVSLQVNGDCLNVDNDGEQQQLCGKDMAEAVARYAEVGGTTLTAQQLAAIERAILGYFQAGLVTTEVDGKWYVSPSRSFGDISIGFLRKLQPGDLETLINLTK